METIVQEQSITYCLYARKSSGSDERQVMSIDSQIKEMQDLATRQNLVVKEIRQENHLAKESGQRPVFAGLLENIDKFLLMMLCSQVKSENDQKGR